MSTYAPSRPMRTAVWKHRADRFCAGKTGEPVRSRPATVAQTLGYGDRLSSTVPLKTQVPDVPVAEAYTDWLVASFCNRIRFRSHVFQR